jgi:hypothetical protein
LELGFTRDTTRGDNVTLQQIIDGRISFLKEQIDPENKPEVKKTFQVQIEAIRSVDDIEKVESIILQKNPCNFHHCTYSSLPNLKV